MDTQVKLVLTWDIKRGQEQHYFTFITQEFPGALNEAGFRLTDAWLTLYGDWPQVSMGFLGDDLPTLQAFLVSEMWLELKQRLLSCTERFAQKIVKAREDDFQI